MDFPTRPSCPGEEDGLFGQLHTEARAGHARSLAGEASAELRQQQKDGEKVT